MIASVCVTCHNDRTNPNFETCQNCNSTVHSDPLCSKTTIDGILCAICQTRKRIQEQRGCAKRQLEDQAERMLIASRQRFEEAKVGQNVVVRIPDVDRGRADPHNIMAIVLNADEGFYKLGTKNGILDRLYVRNEIEICEQQVFTVDDVKHTAEISLRQAVGLASVTGHSQGFIKCSCNTKCKNNICKCKKAKQLCNSKCHNSLSCCNK